MINKPSNPFLITGSSRTGTNLMRLIMDSHPDVIAYGEPESFRCFLMPHYIQKHAKAVGFQVTNWMYDLWKSVFWGDALVVYMKRNTLDTIQSFIKTNRYEPAFEVFEDDRENPQFDDHSNMFRELMGPELAYAYALTGDDQKYAYIVVWLKWCQKILHIIRKDLNVVAVDYDNLILNPEPVCRHICNQLGLDWNDKVLSHHLIESRSESRDGFTFGGTAIHRPIDLASLGQFQSNNNQTQIVLDIFNMNNGRVIHKDNRELLDITTHCTPKNANECLVHTCIDLPFVMDIKNGDKVLDVGCFVGRDIQILQHLHEKLDITGLDHFEFPQFKERANAKFVLGDCKRLPFDDKSFDVAYCNAVFPELTQEEQNETLNEMTRVANKVYYTELHENGIYSIGER